MAAAPFLGGVRWVRVDGIARASACRDAAAASWGNGTDSPRCWNKSPATTILIFVEDELRRGNPMLQLIEPLADTREFARLKPEEALEWLRGEVRRRGLHLTRNAAQTLVERAGGDRGSLTQAVDKLSLYAGRCERRRDHRRSDGAGDPIGLHLNLVDAVAERRLADAMQALDGVRAEGEPEARIIQMLARTFRQIVVTREVIDRGGSNEEIQQATLASFAWLARRCGVRPSPTRKPRPMPR